mgnify:CR=1 FL=1
MDSLNNIFCPNCGNSMTTEERFCKKCGAVNPAYSTSPTTPQPPVADAVTEFIPTQPQNTTTPNYTANQPTTYAPISNAGQTQAPGYTTNTISPTYMGTPNMMQPTPPEKKKSNKGLIAAIISVTSVLVIVGVFLTLILTHVICINHNWEEATCEKAKTCSYCDKTEGDVAGHKWKDATCVEAKTCSVCKKKSGEPLGHTDGEWVVTTEPTLMATGSESLACATCGEALDERSVSEKDAKAERTSFNFKDDEFIQWLEDEGDGDIEIGSLIETTDDGDTMYKITTFDGKTGVLLLCHVNNDPNGNVKFIMVSFGDNVVNSAAVICFIGERIDIKFDSLTASSYIYTYDSVYEAGGMTACIIENDGLKVAVLVPSDILSEVESA